MGVGAAYFRVGAGLAAVAVAAAVLTTQAPTNAASLASAERLCCQIQINPPSPTVPPVLGRVSLISCDAVSERVVVRNETGVAISLAGYVLHDRGVKHTTPLDQWGVLGAGASLTILSGRNPVAGPGEVVWLVNNVWNDDGDEATLIAPDGTRSIASC